MSDFQTRQEHDFEKLLKKNPKPTKKQVRDAERGEGGEKIRDAIIAGNGDITRGVKRLRLDKPGLASALKKVKKPNGR